MPETSARLRYHRASPSKVRQVLRLIAGQDVYEAREILRFCERSSAEPIMKLLDSAVANASHNDNVPDDELFVARAFADEGPTFKRGRPRARGRYGRIKKRTSHITIVVARYDDEALERRREREAAAAGPARVSRRRRVAASRRRSRAQVPAEAHDHDDEELAEALEAEHLDTAAREVEDLEEAEELETEPDEVEEAGADRDAEEEIETDEVPPEGSDERSEVEASGPEREGGE
jgi:large subunit ribosomal protein L22